MVLAGKTLSPASHRWAAGERATLRAASGDRTTPAERADRPKQLAGWANSAGTMGQQCRDHGPKPTQHHAPIFLNFQFLLRFQKIM
jgi:hypothetical protein